MIILEPNAGKEFVPIAKQHSYVCVTDTRQKSFLKQIKISPGQYTWEWVSLRSDRFVDLEGISNRYCSFDNAVNRAVNDSYCTVYGFDNHDEMISQWDDIKYIDSITTVYKGKE